MAAIMQQIWLLLVFLMPLRLLCLPCLLRLLCLLRHLGHAGPDSVMHHRHMLQLLSQDRVPPCPHPPTSTLSPPALTALRPR